MSQSEGSKLTRDLFGVVFLVQVVSFLVFVLDNLNSLDSVTVTLDVAGTEQTSTINVYALLGLVALVFVVVLLTSVSILGLGFNDEGTRTIARYLSYMVVYALSSISLAFYLGVLGGLFTALELVFVVVYLMHVVGGYI